MAEIFTSADPPPTRVTVVHTDDGFGVTQARQFASAVKAMSPGFDVVDSIALPASAADVSAEVSRIKATRPDVIAPITQTSIVAPLLRELARQRVSCLGMISPGAPGLHEPAQIAELKDLLEHVMNTVPWPNFKNPVTVKVARAYARRTGGRAMPAATGYSYDAVTVLADAFQRAASTDPNALAGAIRTTNLADPVMVSAGPVTFDDVGDNPNAATAMIQILGQRPVVVWPADVAMQTFVFPRP